MANTCTQTYLHVVFALEGRQNLVQPEHNDELQKNITGIVSGQKQKLIAINNMPDHVHLLAGLKPDMVLSVWFLASMIWRASSGLVVLRLVRWPVVLSTQ